MIVTPSGERLRLVTQPDHAHVASEILALWRSDGLPGHPRRSELLLAAREHDNGWREADAAPRLDARGRPADFRDFPTPERMEVWRRGISRLAEAHAYAALLVAEHAIALHEARRAEPEWAAFLAELGERRSELMATAGAGEADLAADYRFLHLADAVSLTACAGLALLRAYGTSGRRAGDVLSLSPFPLGGRTTFRVPCRYVPDRPYRGEADLAAELGPARWEELLFRLAPP